MKHWFFLAALSISLVPIAALAQPARVGSTPSGNVLQTPDGKTLYVHDGDKITLGQRGKSSCDKACAQQWPPFSAGWDAQPIGNWGIIIRTDGSRQWTYKGRPLYTWSKDTEPRQTDGNGYNGNNWHVAKP